MSNEELTSGQWRFFTSPYGSRLYGTATPTSDTDEKVIYVPSLDSLLLGKKLTIYKERVDAQGNKVPDNVSMPDGGVETEHIPLQTFVRDFVRGQAYALEVAYAYVGRGKPAPGVVYSIELETYHFLQQLIEKFGNSDVYSMVSFAKKQTLDYVHRGERLNKAIAVLEVIERYIKKAITDGYEPLPRLDTLHNNKPILDWVALDTGLKIGTSTNGNRAMRTLELNGRSYLETTDLDHLAIQLRKVIDAYGARTNAAAEQAVDFKSLSHAVRVYQQAIELLDTGWITFPRQNAAELLAIKRGEADLENVKELLNQLDAEVQAKVLASSIQKRTPELEEAAEKWLLKQLHVLYVLSV